MAIPGNLKYMHIIFVLLVDKIIAFTESCNNGLWNKRLDTIQNLEVCLYSHLQNLANVIGTHTNVLNPQFYRSVI